MIWLLIAAMPFLAAYAVVARRTGGFATPDALFIAFNTVGLLGTVLVIDASAPVDRRYAWVVWSGLVMFTTTAAAYRHVRLRDRKPIPHELLATPLSRWLLGLYALSLVVSLLYYVAVGRIVLLDSLWAAVTGHSYDTQTARLNSYSAGRYTFPGYANQFKNAILPIVTMAIVHNVWVRRIRGWLPISVLMVGVSFVFLAGTGQRGAFVTTAIVIALTILRARLLSGLRLALAGAAALAAFLVLTTLLQRQAAQLASASNPWDKAWILLTAVWDRAVLVNPFSGLAATAFTRPLAAQRPSRSGVASTTTSGHSSGLSWSCSLHWRSRGSPEPCSCRSPTDRTGWTASLHCR
jgi:hypothetical protein